MLKDRLLFNDKDFVKSTLAIAIPVSLQNIISFGVNCMDSVMLGKLGDIAVSGANLGGSPFFLLMISCFGISSGGAVLIAQYWGKGNKDVIRRVMRISMTVTLIVATIATIACFFFTEPIMHLYSNEEEVIQASASYLKTLSLGFIVWALSSNYFSSLRAVENVKISTTIYAASFFVNVFANYVFIFGKFGAPRLEIVGAALGTVIARAFEFLCALYYMYFKEKNIGYKLHTMLKIDFSLVGDFIKHALPVIGNEMIWGLGSQITSMIIGRMGSGFVAANSVTNVVSQLVQVAIFGVADSASVLCGKTIGTGDLPRAQKTADTLMVMALMCGICGSGIVFLIRTPFIAFYEISPQAKEMAHSMMTMLAVIQPFLALDMVNITGIMRGGGDTKVALVFDATSMWLMNIPRALLVAFVLKWPPQYVYIAIRISSFIVVPLQVKRIMSGKWIRIVTRENAN